MPDSVIRAEKYLQGQQDILVLKESVEGFCLGHSHEFVEIAYIASGKGIHTVEGTSDAVLKGDLFLLGEKVSHEFSAHPGYPLLVYNCLFLPSAITGAFDTDSGFVDIAYRYLYHSVQDDHTEKNYIKLIGADSGDMERILENMHRECEDKREGYRQMVKLDLIRLLIMIFRLHREYSHSGRRRGIFKRLVVQSTLKYMKEHYADNIRCEELAARAYLSPTYFSRIFKSETGKTIIDLLQDIRIDEACLLLRNSDCSVTEIAERVGYADLKHFYRIFERRKGVTPGGYRSKGENA